MRRLAALGGALALMVLAGCSGANAGSPDADGRLLVATTVSPITSIAAAVAGDLVDIEGIVPEGTNSHTFEPKPDTAKLLSTADVIFVNGLKLEDPTLELARANMKSGAEIIEIGTLVLPESEYIYDFSFPKEGGKPNPHLWTDTQFAIKYAQLIRDELSARDPANASAYAANTEAFAQKVNELDVALRKDQETIPGGRRVLLTYHDAYAYFAKNFGWQVVGALQPSDFGDPAPNEVASLIEQVKTQGVRTIFGSEVFPSAVLKEVANATGARFEASLRDDDLPGKPGDPDHSWLGLMQYNYATMVKGLGGTSTNIDAVRISLATPDTAKYPQ
jgi:ABC-type Zn uptake system ZnuABC Zn-binding protein ZnuA